MAGKTSRAKCRRPTRCKRGGGDVSHLEKQNDHQAAGGRADEIGAVEQPDRRRRARQRKRDHNARQDKRYRQRQRSNRQGRNLTGGSPAHRRKWDGEVCHVRNRKRQRERQGAKRQDLACARGCERITADENEDGTRRHPEHRH